MPRPASFPCLNCRARSNPPTGPCPGGACLDFTAIPGVGLGSFYCDAFQSLTDVVAALFGELGIHPSPEGIEHVIVGGPAHPVFVGDHGHRFGILGLKGHVIPCGRDPSDRTVDEARRVVVCFVRDREERRRLGSRVTGAVVLVWPPRVITQPRRDTFAHLLYSLSERIYASSPEGSFLNGPCLSVSGKEQEEIFLLVSQSLSSFSLRDLKYYAR